MPILGIELCDAGFRAATIDDQGRPTVLPIPNAENPLGWLGLVRYDGQSFSFGRDAEENWFIHPRQISHDFWARLSREFGALSERGKALSFSQLGFYFLRDYWERVSRERSAPEKLMLAVPVGYLKDTATEDEKIGLLLGMAGELKLPLVGIMDMASAAVSDPRIENIDPAQLLLLVDIHLHGSEITLLRRDGNRFARQDYAFLPQSGYAEFLRLTTTSMGNRFLRHTTFDILEDGRIEQAFYAQTKDFLLSRAAEYHYQINAGTRVYEMTATRDQLAADCSSLVVALTHAARALVQRVASGSRGFAVAFTDRIGLLPGASERFRAAGLTNLFHLPHGAAAAGAAAAAATHDLSKDLADIPVESFSLPLAISAVPAGRGQLNLVKTRRRTALGPPTHAICEGQGHALNGHAVVTIGSRTDGIRLPEEFEAAGQDWHARLEQRGGHWWLCTEAHGGEDTMIESGDRLQLRWGAAETEVLFAACAEAPRGTRSRD